MKPRRPENAETCPRYWQDEKNANLFHYCGESVLWVERPNGVRSCLTCGQRWRKVHTDVNMSRAVHLMGQVIVTQEEIINV